jgi:hypothetical protein
MCCDDEGLEDAEDVDAREVCRRRKHRGIKVF